MTHDLPPNTPRYKHDQLAELMQMFGEMQFPDAPTLYTRCHRDPKAAAARVEHAFRAAYEAAEEEARDADLPVHCNSTMHRLFSAALSMVTHWEDRTRSLERTLRHVLANDLVTDDQRTEILAVLYGRAGVGRDPKTLNEHEAELIRLYRAGNAADKAMVRTLFARLWGSAK
jgi:hypothetical protein